MRPLARIVHGLTQRRAAVRRLRKKLKEEPSEADKLKLETKRKALGARILNLLALLNDALLSISPAYPVLPAAAIDGYPEDAQLGLPSSFTLKAKPTVPGFDVLAKFEMSLREAEASDALRDLRDKITLVAQLDFRKSKMSNKSDKTRAGTSQKTTATNVNATADWYRLVHKKMKNLGLADDTTFRTLDSTDLRTPLRVYGRAGESKSTLSWIWRQGDTSVAAGFDQESWGDLGAHCPAADLWC